MKQLVAIYDIGAIRAEFVNICWYQCFSISFWNRQQAEQMFYVWLVGNLESLYYIVPDQHTSQKKNGLYFNYLDHHFYHLIQELFKTVKVPAFSGDYRCHVNLINDDLFLIFN